MKNSKISMVSATALCYGAATVVNAIATGRGAAFGIGLEAKVTVELRESGGVTAIDVAEPKLVETCVKNTLKLFPYNYGAVIKVESNIPVARGLKSSSAVANAAVLATFGALAKKHGSMKMLRVDKETTRQQITIGRDEVKDELVLDISVKSAKEAGVTITGALDDASACYFGGFAVTDNTNNKIVRKGDLEKLSAVVFVPDEKAYTKDTDVEALKAFDRELGAIWNLALQGDLYTAMTLNGLVCSTALWPNSRLKAVGGGGAKPTEIAAAAMKAGAIAAGLSGKGPAVVAIIRGDADRILDAWQGFEGKLIETKVNNEKARVIL
jgi:shikimate kinase